jgi:hypothetical protein
MKDAREEVCMEQGNCCKPMKSYSISLVIYFVFLFFTLGAMQAQAEWPCVVTSEDGTPISYERSMALESRHSYSCMVGAVMPATGAPNFHTFLKITAWSCLISQATATQVRHVHSTP